MVENCYLKINSHYRAINKNDLLGLINSSKAFDAPYYITPECGLSSDAAAEGKFYILRPRLRGGKGGFSTQIRNEAMHKKRFTDTYNARDLQGRRVGDVKNEILLKKWLLQKDHPKEENRKKTQKEVKVNIDDCVKKGEALASSISSSVTKYKKEENSSIKTDKKLDLKQYLQQIKEEDNAKAQIASKLDRDRSTEDKEKYEPNIIDIKAIGNIDEVKSHHPEDIKFTLKSLGAKIGGRPEERIQRLWDIKLNPDLINSKKYKQ